MPDSFEEIRPVFRATLATVNWLHETIESFHSALLQTTAELVETKDNEFNNYRSVDLKYQRFSDGLILFVPLFGDPTPKMVNGLYGLIAICGSFGLLGLTRKTPIRGGLDLAWGMELKNNELYGCVVANAYKLENEIAQYPRIVVGEHILGCLNSWQNLPENDHYTSYIHEISKICLGMLIRDSDDRIIVDYLGKGFKKYIANTIDESTYTDAYSYVQNQLEKWGNLNDQKLYSRYLELDKYFRKNAENWKYSE